jgi:hypothetical protein
MTEMTATESPVGLFAEVLSAAGGIDCWRKHSFLSAHLVQGGGLWPMKGQGGVLDDPRETFAEHSLTHHGRVCSSPTSWEPRCGRISRSRFA